MDGTWEPIKQLDPKVTENLRGDLATLDRLHRSWQDSIQGFQMRMATITAMATAM